MKLRTPASLLLAAFIVASCNNSTPEKPKPAASPTPDFFEIAKAPDAPPNDFTIAEISGNVVISGHFEACGPDKKRAFQDFIASQFPYKEEKPTQEDMQGLLRTWKRYIGNRAQELAQLDTASYASLPMSPKTGKADPVVNEHLSLKKQELKKYLTSIEAGELRVLYYAQASRIGGSDATAEATRNLDYERKSGFPFRDIKSGVYPEIPHPACLIPEAAK